MVNTLILVLATIKVDTVKPRLWPKASPPSQCHHIRCTARGERVCCGALVSIDNDAHLTFSFRLLPRLWLELEFEWRNWGGGRGGSSYSERYTVQICYHSAVWTSFHERLLISSYGTIVNVYRLSSDIFIINIYSINISLLMGVWGLCLFFDRKKTKTSIVNSNSAGTETKEA